MFGRSKHPMTPAPKMTKQHEQIRQEVIESRELLLKEIAKLNKKFDITQTRKKP